jgi:thymidylate kinase
MIIEFAGLPGCGKSTQRDLLIAHLSRQGVSLATPRAPRAGALPPRLRLHGRRAFIVLAHARLLSFAVRVLLASSRSPRDKLLALKWLVLALDDYAFMRRQPHDQVYVCDEGIAQRAFTLFTEGTSRADPSSVRRFLSRAPRPDVLIDLEIDPAAAVERLENRRVGLPPRLRSLERETVEERLANARADILTVARESFLSGRVAVHVVEAGSDVSTIAAGIATFVDEQLDSALHHP